jgi:hypothetical protein
MLKHRRFILSAILVMLLSLTVLTVFAGPTADAIDWEVLASGGNPATSGNIRINSTVGQALVSPASTGNIGFKSGYWGSGNGPTAVTLSSFTARPLVRSILLTWETTMEIDLAGFQVYRSTSPNSPFVQVTELIPTEGIGSGMVYQWCDSSVIPGTVYYNALQAVHYADEPTWFHAEPVIAQANGVYLPLVRR